MLNSDIKYRMRGLSATAWLIIINVAVFIIVWITRLPLADTGLSSGIPLLGKRFWTPLSYMFVHYSFWHLLMNMLWLWMFGRILEFSVQGRRIWLVYIVGGLTGALFYLVAGCFSDDPRILCGASASVVALMTAAGMRSPNMVVRLWLIGDVKLKWIVVAGVVLLFIGAGGGGLWAHLGGLCFGIFSQLPVFSRISIFRHRSVSRKKQHRPSARKARKLAKDLQRRRRDMERLDELLDQVRLSGFDSLSKAEKAELQRLSQSLGGDKEKQ